MNTINIMATTIKITDYTIREDKHSKLTLKLKTYLLLKFQTKHIVTWMDKASLGNDLVNTLKHATIEAVSQ
jgi:hypothetical protein